MALPVNTPAESTLNLGAIPTMLARTADTPIALTSAGNTTPTMVNPTMAATQSGLDALTGAGLGGMLGMLLDRNGKPATKTSSADLFKGPSSPGGPGSSPSSSPGGGGGSTATPSTPGVGGSTSGTSNQSDTMLGGMTGNTQSITTGYLQDADGNLYKDLGDGTAQLWYSNIGNTNYQYEGPAYTNTQDQLISPGAIMDQQGVQIAPNWNWFSNQASGQTTNTGNLTDTLGTSLQDTAWENYTGPTYPSYLDSGNDGIDTSNTDYWTYIDTSGGPNWGWKSGGLATPMYANGGQVKGYADGDLVTTTDVTANPTALASATPTSFTDQVVANQLGTGATNTAATTTDTTGGTTSPLSSITDLLSKNSGISGALIGALLGQLLGGKSSGTVNTGVDMSRMAGIAPRTTNFGIGPSNFAPYTAYGTSPGTSPAYGGLYSNLGVSGYGSNANPLLARRVSTAASPFYTFGNPVDPSKYMAEGGEATTGGLSSVHEHNPNIPMLGGVNPNVPKIGHRNDYRKGSYVEGPGDGQSDDIPAMLADGEYVIDAETVAQLGNGSNKAGAKILDKFRENIREHKRSAPHDKIPPKAKSPLAYLKGTK